MVNKYHINIDQQQGRIDKVLQEELQMSRSQVQQLLKKECVSVNGDTIKANYKVKFGDDITVHAPIEEPIAVLPENIPLTIVFEDDDIVVVNKDSGMVVHPSKSHHSGTLVNALLHHVTNLSSGTGEVRPGIVHRIDKDTSGLLVVAKNNEAHQHLSNQLQEHTMTREYIALVHGVIEEETGTIIAPLARDKHDRLKYAVNEDGKYAVTSFKVLQRFKEHTLVSLTLETGRTHQIRVHMSFIGHDLVGDPVYSRYQDDKTFGQYLHAKKIGFIHPVTKDYCEFDSDFPEYFARKLEQI